MADEIKNPAENEAEDTVGKSIDVPSLDELKKSGIDISAPLPAHREPPTVTATPQPVQPQPIVPASPAPAPVLPPQDASPSRAFVVPPPIQAPVAPEPVKVTGVLEKQFPSPQELAKPAQELPPIPSKVSLADIPLPDYMKGNINRGQPQTPKTPTPQDIDPLLKAAIETALPGDKKGTVTLHEETPIERSMREIGVTQAPARLRPNMKIVSNRFDKKTELDENGLPRIRTYAADLSEEIRKRGATLTTIVGAERERQAQEEARENEIQEDRRDAVKKTLYLGGGALLLIAGIAAITVAFFFSGSKPVDVLPPSIIPTNAQSRVDITDVNEFVSTLGALKKNSALSLGEVEEFVLTKDGQRMSPEEIMTLFGAPNALARNTTSVMVGIHAFDRNQPFLIVTVSSYDIVFNAMLTWEKNMAETLGDFFAPVNRPQRVPILTFTDRVLKNTDLRQSQVEWPIIYSFPERTILIMATNESTLREIISRLAVSSAR